MNLSNILNYYETQINVALHTAISALVADGELPQNSVDSGKILVETPKDDKNGDFATTVALQLAKSSKMPPRDVAQKIVSALKSDTLPFVGNIALAGPGFINFYLTQTAVMAVLEAIDTGAGKFGCTDIGGGKKVMVEFVSSNPTGPMHMGNARGGAVGDVLSSVLSAAGYDVTREFYVNDAGNQIERFAQSLDARYIQHLRGEDAAEFPQDGYHGDDIVELAMGFANEYGDMIDKPEQQRRDVMVKYALAKNIAGVRADLERYRIVYDVWFMESQLHNSGEIAAVINILTKNGYTYEKEGALWFDFCKLGGDKDEVLLRTNGVPTYFAADVAYHYNKFVTRGFDRSIEVWGADHHGHTFRMKAAMTAIGIDQSRLEFVIIQLVRLMRSGEMVRMSKRSGKAVSLMDLVDEIGVDAARFFFNMRAANSHFDFDLDLAVQQTNDNPVFYVQYAHARVCSIVTMLAGDGVAVPQFGEIDASLLCAAEEQNLAKMLMRYPDEIRIAASLLEPSKITRYAIDLAAAFHGFYNACHVRGGDAELTKARLKLASCTGVVLKNVLTLLGVSAPEAM